jgi:carbamoyltransferase
MGLAAFGDPQGFAAAMDRLFQVQPCGPACDSGGLPFLVDLELARFRAGDVAGLESLFGRRRRPDESPTVERFADVAAALQSRTEDALLGMARRLKRATGESRLAYGGGVALNCLANSRLERDGPFDAIHVYAAPHDAGTAVGAALETARRIAGHDACWPGAAGHRLTPLLGDEYPPKAIDAAIDRWGLPSQRVADPAARAAGLLADGQIVAWFQGRMEFGPRALGNRSLLADPRSPQTRDRLNGRIKHRESFRPFAAAVREEQAAIWFELPGDREGAQGSRELMLLAYPVRGEFRSKIPAVVHRDGTCRIQTVSRERHPQLHRLLSVFFEWTGVPLLLNTSFNEQEPLVRTPDDALATFVKTDVDALFLNDRLVVRRK